MAVVLPLAWKLWQTRNMTNIKGLVPGFIKRGIKAAISSPTPQGADAIEQARGAVEHDINTLLPPSKLTTEPGISTAAVFHNFFADFNRLCDENKEESLKILKKDYPALTSVAAPARDFLNHCSTISPPLDSAVRRQFFNNLPFVNSPLSYELLNYKNKLPRVGLLYYPNPEPKDFLIDSLEGLCQVDDMEPGELLSRVWQGRECDFNLYRQILKDEIKSELEKLPQSFWQHFPDQEWFLNEITQHTQYQMAFKQLLDQDYWDLIIVGAMETSLGHTLYDCLDGKRPPVLYFHHGHLSGEPLENLFLKADHYLAKGKPEENYFLNLGISKEQITTFGSIREEAFPRPEAIEAERHRQRLALNIPDDATAIVYGLTLDIYLYEKKTCEELTELMIESFAKLASEEKVHKPYLFLKYHPAPRSDKYFSFSRKQMPLHHFYDRLKPLGYELRLIKELKPYLKAADCFVAHESATLIDALELGCPTLSLLYHQGKGQPLMSFEAYGEHKSHRLLTDFDEPATIASVIKEITDCPRQQVCKEGEAVWQAIFGQGRTDSVAKMLKLANSYLRSNSE